MKYVYLFIIGGISMVWLQPVTATTVGLSSTYQPSVHVVIDETTANSSVIIRAHDNYHHKQHNRVYRCTQGVCLFRANHHTYENDWTYFVEQLKAKLPASAKTPKQRLKFYYDNKSKVTLSVNVTAQITTADFSPQTQMIDYNLDVNSTDHTAVIIKHNQGEYDPLRQSIGFQLWGFSDTMLKLIGAGLAIVITYVGVRYIPVSVHHH